MSTTPPTTNPSTTTAHSSIQPNAPRHPSEHIPGPNYTTPANQSYEVFTSLFETHPALFIRLSGNDMSGQDQCLVYVLLPENQQLEFKRRQKSGKDIKRPVGFIRADQLSQFTTFVQNSHANYADQGENEPDRFRTWVEQLKMNAGNLMQWD